MHHDVLPDFVHLAEVRSRLTAALRDADVLPESRLNDLRLVVSEGVTNAIEAHHRCGSDEPIGLTISVTAKKVMVKIVDRGTGFDPDGLTEHPPVTDPKRLEYERGLGVTLMKRMTDICDIASNKSGTTVTLTMLR